MDRIGGSFKREPAKEIYKTAPKHLGISTIPIHKQFIAYGEFNAHVSMTPAYILEKIIIFRNIVEYV